MFTNLQTTYKHKCGTHAHPSSQIIHNSTKLRVRKQPLLLLLCVLHSLNIIVVTSFFFVVYVQNTHIREYSSMLAIGMNENHWFYYTIFFCSLHYTMDTDWFYTLVFILLYVCISQFSKSINITWILVFQCVRQLSVCGLVCVCFACSWLLIETWFFMLMFNSVLRARERE